ncbi:hypothetical protein [Mycobacterium sp. DBP42]|uniref:hypothetical protein n=1 Tax=Mycobacterium sp. DBP42 TaxID=2545267 RepID=UPI00110C9B51|nr:hypothetical protein [Mycobacterium sp. DBP42]TMS54805.1 hypothetical protein E0T84_04390 [Mycobacterium sp. DBP42]
MTPTVEFRDDDDGYLRWLVEHPTGYVLNIQRGYSPADARVHRANCSTIGGRSIPGKTLTESYVKHCADYLEDLTRWAITTVQQEIRPCGTCRPTSALGTTTNENEDSAPTSLEFDEHFAIRGPQSDNPVVEARADDYIRFERLPSWQLSLRSQIRSRCNLLRPSASEVLHAKYFGAKPPNADVENRVLYNIGTFKAAGQNGIRFEHGHSFSEPEDRAEYPYAYRYALAPRGGGFDDWRPGRKLASFEWTDVGKLTRNPKLAEIWLALARNPGQLYAPCRAPGTPYVLKVEVRAPRGRHPVWGALVKSIFDGVICAHQAHTDTETVPVVADRIAAALGEAPEEIAKLLLDQRRNAIGLVPKLVKPFGAGVQWHPSDEMCVAGELLAAESSDQQGRTGDQAWAIKGQIMELIRRVP